MQCELEQKKFNSKYKIHPLAFCFPISFFDKGEGGEEGQQRQCSMDEETTQGTGGKYCCVDVHMCLLSRLCVSAHAGMSEQEISISTVVYKCRFIHVCTFFQVLQPPDAAVPNTEIEKEEEESSSQAQTPAEESGVKVRAWFYSPGTGMSSPPQASGLILPPCLVVSRCPSALKYTPSTPM